MKLASFRKLRTWTLKQRNRVSDIVVREPDNGGLNVYRRRLVGQIEAYDRVLDRMDAFIRFHKTAWHDRRKKRA